MECRCAEAGKGAITLKDIRRMAYTHDFTWTEKEMADMIHCFDSDGDGKVNTGTYFYLIFVSHNRQLIETNDRELIQNI